MASKAVEKPIRVAIIGSGISGLGAAFALSQHPEKFKVTIIDKLHVCGGMATSEDIDEAKFGASYVNDGVQGGSPQFFNVYKFFKMQGFVPTEVGLQLSFGKGKKEFWTNVFPSELIEKHQKSISRLGWTLKIVKFFEPIFALMSVQTMLKLFMFPQDFSDRLVLPLLALFMGTGNQTPHVSAAIFERLFLDPSMALFEFSPDNLVSDIPTMMAFPKLRDVYEAWRKYLISKGVEIRLKTEVTEIVQRKKNNVVLKFAPTKDEWVKGEGSGETTETFDQLIMAVDADSALKILKKQSTWRERRILGNVKYFWDVSVTHWDKAYMDKYLELEYKEELVAQNRKSEYVCQTAMAYAEKEFRPLYFIHSYPDDPKRIEMSFDLTNYQPQFKLIKPSGPDYPAQPKQMPITGFPHVYQTIFLNKERSDQWTKNEIDKDKILIEKWWKQQGHNWTHYLGTVPWMWALNGQNETHYAGAWGLVNMHEIGLLSGFAAAYKLGADYPFADDKNARRLFEAVLALFHLSKMRKEEKDSKKNR